MLSSSTRSRGSALLFVVIALALLAIIGLAAVEFTGRDMGIAATMERKSAVDRCAAAARGYLTAEYRNSAANIPSNMQLAIAMNGQTNETTVRLVPNLHIDGTVAGLPVHGYGAGSRNMGNITNSFFQGSVSSDVGAIAPVLCSELTAAFPDGGGRASEFEIYVRAKL